MGLGQKTRAKAFLFLFSFDGMAAAARCGLHLFCWKLLTASWAERTPAVIEAVWQAHVQEIFFEGVCKLHTHISTGTSLMVTRSAARRGVVLIITL
jgi:hypothetical protein